MAQYSAYSEGRKRSADRGRGTFGGDGYGERGSGELDPARQMALVYENPGVGHDVPRDVPVVTLDATGWHGLVDLLHEMIRF